MSEKENKDPVVAQVDVREFSGFTLHTEVATFKLGGLDGSISNGVEGTIIVKMGKRYFYVAPVSVVRAVESVVFPEGIPNEG